MPTLVLDPQTEEELLRQRRACRGDRHDEVWEGVYVMSPMANNEHQEIINNLATALSNAFASRTEVRVFPGINVSDRRRGWEKNYRCPDVAVVFPNSKAIDCDTFFFGGPDFVVEIASDYDRSREKFDFYAIVGVREFLLVDRNPWQLELYRLQKEKLVLVGISDPAANQTLSCDSLSLTFQLLSPTANTRPRIEIHQPTTNTRWLA
jgi:Uma2 family endonuclease